MIMESEKPKRKTKTSIKAVKKYVAKTYSPITAYLKKELVAEFKAKCKKNGVSIASVVQKGIEDYLQHN